jgi:hypothetical protein
MAKVFIICAYHNPNIRKIVMALTRLDRVIDRAIHAFAVLQ